MKRTLRPVRPSSAIQSKYRRKLVDLLDRMQASVFWWLRARYRSEEKKIVQDGASKTLQQEINELKRQWKKTYRSEGQTIAEWFAKNTRGYSARAINTVLNDAYKKDPKATQGIKLLEFKYMSRRERDVLKAIVQENVNLIKSIPDQYFTQLEGTIMRGVENGRDLGYITDEIEKRYDITKRRAEMISRDQTAKATENLSRARLYDCGVTQGKWMHTASGKTYRKSHVEMDGTVYDLAKGCYDPDEGREIFPGELINCRCVCVPVIGGE